MLNIDPLIIENPSATDSAIASLANELYGWLTDELTFAAVAESLTASLPGDTAKARADAATAILDDVLATIAAHASPSVQVIAGTLTSGGRVALGSPAIRGKLQSVLSANQLSALLPLLRTAPFVSPADVAEARVILTRTTEADAALIAFETFASAFRDQVNAYVAGNGTLPEVPTLA